MQIPTAWLWVSGIFFFVNIIFFGVLIFALIKLMEVAQEMKPKIDRIADRVDSISEKVDSMASDIQGRVKDISTTSAKLTSSADILTNLSSQTLTKFAPYFAAFGFAMKAYQVLKANGVTFPKRGPAKKSSGPAHTSESHGEGHQKSLPQGSKTKSKTK